MKLRKKNLLALGLSTSVLISSVMPVSAAALENGTPYNVLNTSVQAQANVDETQLSPWLITEAVTDSVSGEKYTYLEVYNNSDEELDFADYNLYYDYPSAAGGYIFSKNAAATYTYGKKYTQGAYLSPESDEQLSSIPIGSGEAFVIWYCNNLKTTSLKEFRDYYGIDENVTVVRVPHGGIHSSAKRGYRIGKDSDTILVQAFSDEYGNEIADGNNKLAYQYTFPTSGRKCSKMSIETATPGKVTAGQVPETRVTVVEKPVTINNVQASGKGDFTVTAEIPYEGTSGAMSVKLTYAQSGGTGEDAITTEKKTVEMTAVGDGKTFKAVISAKEIFGTSITYSVSAGYSAETKDTTDEQTVDVTKSTEVVEGGAPLVITEVESVDSSYTYFEVYNQSDKPINLAYWKIFYYYNYPNQTAAQSGKTWSLSDFTLMLQPGKTMVCWLDNKGNTVDDFNEHYGTNLVEGETITKVNYAGFHATDARWIRLGTTEDDAFTLVGFNQEKWQTVGSNTGKSLNYAVPNDVSGLVETIPVSVEDATPGTLKSWQTKGQSVTFGGYPGYAEDDGKLPTLKVCEEEGKLIPESINEGEKLAVMYDVDLLVGATSADRVNAFKDNVSLHNPTNQPGGSEALKTRPGLIGTEIYYKLDDDSEWTVVKEKKQWVLGHYWMQIPSDILYGHDKVTFKVRAYSLYGYSETEENTVKINRLNNTDGKVRLNVNDVEVISGVKTITANDGNNNENTVIKVDGVQQTVKNTFENGAYFIIKTSGVDSYFKDAITAPFGGNAREIITYMVSWCETPASRATRVDNKFFKYNEETDSYDVTLTVWAGGPGTPFEEIYEIIKNENHEDFTVTGLQLKLTNGKSYLPVSISPNNEKTNTDTSLDAVHTIGDSAGMIPYMNVTFSVPVADAEAVGTEVDTKELSDGVHTITAISGDKTTEVNVVVDNTAPDINFGIEQGATLYNNITLDGSMITDTNGIEDAVVTVDDELVTLPYTIQPNELSSGEHTIKIAATDTVGNTTTKDIVFKTEDVNPSVKEESNDGIGYQSANLSVTLGGEQTADVTFLEGQKLSIDNSGITTDGVVNSSEGNAPYQIFDINTGDVSADTEIALKWNGTASNTDKTHKITMFALNQSDNKWYSVGTADENGNINAEFLAENYVKDGKATVLVQCVTDGNKPNVYEANTETKTTDDNSEWDGTGRPENYDFSFAWITDTQYYTESFPYHFDNMNQWIVDNAKDWDIRYVFHTGDIVDDCNMNLEWKNADNSMKILDDAGIPYGVLGGNHDVWAGGEDYSNYWKYFGEDRFAGREYYGGSYKNNLGHYDLLTENGQDFIIIYMSWDIYDEELDWMNEVLAKYSDRKAILAFHRYINTAGDLDYTGKLIQEQVVAKNPNVFAVIDGHYHGASFRTDKFDDDNDGVKERTVYQVCTDYQSDAEGGSQYIKFMYFDLKNNKLYMNSYSPYSNDFNYYDTEKVNDYGIEQQVGAIDILDFDVDFGGTESYEKILTTNDITADVRTTNVIGTVENVSSKAEFVWNGLEPETSYGWYAKITNAKNGITKTDVKKFVTLNVPSTPLTANSSLSATTITLGDTVTLNGSATGGTAPYQYAFSAKHSTSAKWTTLKGYNTTSTTTWKPGLVGTYQVCAKVKDANGTEVKQFFTLAVKGTLKNYSTISSTTINKGDTIDLKAFAAGGTAPYQYAFSAKHSTSTEWTTLKGYNSNSAIKWTPGLVGTYQVCVKVKDANGTEVKKFFTVNVEGILKNYSTISSTTINKGDTVALKAVAAGGTASYQYAFSVKHSTSTEWTTLKGYNSTSAINWTPGLTGTYQVCAKVKDTNGTEVKKFFTLTVE